MTVVYSDALVTLHHGDARRLPLADESVGIVITSPPYNCRARYDGYEDWLPFKQYWHGLIEPALWECFRALVPGGRLCLNMANVVRSPLGGEWPEFVDEHIWSLLRGVGFLPRERIGWVKGDRPEDVTAGSTAWGSWRSASNPVLRATSEPIFIADKLTHKREPGQTDITRDEFMAWTRNTWFVPVRETVSGPGANPCQMPPEIPRRLMKLYSYIDDVCLDPFSGECTTLWAAKELGRRAIGVEQGAFQCRRGMRRLARNVAEQPALEDEFIA